MKAESIAIAIGMMLAASAWAEAPDASVPAAAVTSVAAAPETPAAGNTAEQFQKMDDNLDRMRALVGQMRDVDDATERQKLMREYMSAQHENMMLARDAMGMGPGMGMGMGPGMGMGMGPGMGKMDRDECDMDHMRAQRGMAGMGKMDRDDCDMDHMRGMRGMGMMGKKCDMDHMRGMGGMPDGSMMARMQSMEKRLDALQEMMKMMMNR